MEVLAIVGVDNNMVGDPFLMDQG